MDLGVNWNWRVPQAQGDGGWPHLSRMWRVTSGESAGQWDEYAEVGSQSRTLSCIPWLLTHSTLGLAPVHVVR